MNSDKRPSSSGQPAGVRAGVPGQEYILKTGQLQVERKQFKFALTDRARGRSLCIEEGSCAGFANLVIPASGREIFKSVLAEMVAAAAEQPLPFNDLPPKPIRRAQLDEVILKTALFPIERKSFKLVLMENPRGRCLRLTEKAGERFTCVLVPAQGLEEFQMLLDKIVKLSSKPPVSNPAFSPGAPALEHTINSEQMQVGEKTFRFKFQENARGRYLRLIEESPGNFPCTLIIPSTGLEEFKKHTDDMIQTSNENPLKNPPQ
jgi:hypothetical protein